MTIKPIKYTVIIIVSLILPGLSILSYNLYIDPFQIFHKDFEKPYIVFGGRGTDRYQHAGIINNYPVESIILGHSHSANYLPSKLEKELNLSGVFSLTMDGSPIAEQTYIGQYALKKKISNMYFGVLLILTSCNRQINAILNYHLKNIYMIITDLTIYSFF